MPKKQFQGEILSLVYMIGEKQDAGKKKDNHPEAIVQKQKT